jgi:cardiolipin synthase
MLWEVVQYGTAIYWQPAPFDHSKLFVVDDFYVNLGSANLDPRSLRLNFELNLEVFDPELGAELARHIEAIRARSKRVTLEMLDARSFPVKLRDAAAKLFSPYL